MKPKLLLRLWFCIAFAGAFHAANAQKHSTPPGSVAMPGRSGMYEGNNFLFNTHTIYRKLLNGPGKYRFEDVFTTEKEIRNAYLEKRIIEETFYTHFYIIIQYFDGSYSRLKLRFYLEVDDGDDGVETPLPLTPGTTQPTNLAGDDLYCFINNSVYVLRDAVNGPWLLNNDGLPAFPTLYDMNIDSFQNVWLVSNNRLFMQPLVSNTWTLKNNLSGIYRVFIDRFQKIWVGRTGTVAFTTNQGTTMQAGPTGIGSGEGILWLSTDHNGDVYIMTYSSYPFSGGGNKIYRSVGGTANFVRIDNNLASQFPQNANTQIYNGIHADTGIYVTHGAGMHVSKDAGATWDFIPGPPSQSAVSLVSTNDNQLMMSTPPGAFKGNNGNWIKKYPSAGFLPNVNLFRDNGGNIYAQGERISNNSNNNFRYVIYKSSNNGNSFLPDSAGLTAADVGMSPFYIDETGTQHAAGSIYEPGLGNKMMVWKKPPAQPWMLDIGGLPTIYNESVLKFTGDGYGNIYCHFYNANSFRVTYTRTVNGTTWTDVSALGFKGIDDLAGRADGTAVFAVFASGQGAPGGLIKKSGNSFANIPLPAGIVAENITKAKVAFDSSGALWAYFNVYPFYPLPPPPNSIETGSGLFYTTDFTNWKKPANDVDTSLFRSIIAIGDSMFALPQNAEGVHVFKKLASTGTIYTFTGNGNWTNAANWQNNLIPPAILPAGSEIIIQPAGSGECILNTSQTVSAGGKLTVSNAKKLKIVGALNVVQ